MSFEQGDNIQLKKEENRTKQQAFLTMIFEREPNLAPKINKGDIRYEWVENETGNLEGIRFFKKNETVPYAFETLDVFSRSKGPKVTRALR